MPELPEVETVRRGLAPAMEGARIAKVEVRDRRLRWPIAKGFEKRIEGKTVEGLGRRAKYLLADLSSGDVLLMHLGMSGSFRVGKDAKPGVYYHEKSKSTAHDHVVFHMSNGQTVTFNDPRRFGSMKLVPRDKLESEKLLRALGPEPLGNEFDAAMLARACAGKKTSLKAALSDQRVVAGPRQHLCLRGAVPRRAFAQAAGLDHCRPQRQAERARGGAGRCHSRGAQRRHQGGRLLAARPSPGRRFARRFPASFPRL